MVAFIYYKCKTIYEIMIFWKWLLDSPFGPTVPLSLLLCVHKKSKELNNWRSLTFPRYKFWTGFNKNFLFTRHMGGRTGPLKMTLEKNGYIKIVYFELILPVLRNSFNFWDKLTKPGYYWDYISFYNSQKLLSF